MPVIPANLNPTSWGGPYAGSFRPVGPIMYHGRHDDAFRRRNPRERLPGVTRAGRVIVGFNVGNTPRWQMDDLVSIVRRVREEQVKDPSATFVAQRGLYKSFGGDIVDEQGAQVAVIDFHNTPRDEFIDQMVSLGEQIAASFEQEVVIVEIQENGIVVDSYTVTP